MQQLSYTTSRQRFLAMFALAALVLSMTFAALPREASAAPPDAGFTHQVNGTVDSVLGPGTFAGTLTIDRIVNQNGGLVALGTLNGVVTVAGQTIPIVNQLITAPLTIPQAACQVLDLDVGAIHLNLLGLVIDLAPIHLDITAQPGPGNLLGNLVCAVAHLLDGNASGNAIANLLNRILGLLAV